MKELERAPFSIEVNKGNIKAVLKKLEKMGYKWHSGHKPTELVPDAKYLDIGTNNCFGWGYSGAYYGNVISAAAFLKEKQCIVIYRKGYETIALDKTTGKKAVAKCSPEDTYNFYTGAQLAFDRLTGVEEKVVEQPEKQAENEGFNGFVECIKNEYKHCLVMSGFTIGKIYEVKNGKITTDNGYTVVNTYYSVESLCIGVGNTFVEVKKVKRAAKAGEFIEIVAAERVPETNGELDYKNGDILKVIKTMNMHSNGVTAYYKEGMGKFAAEREYVVLEGYVETEEERPEFKPYLKRGDRNYGILGKATPFKDVVDRVLRVGDTVELFGNRNISYGESVVVERDGRIFISGIKGSCKENGKIEGWKAIFKRKYEEIENGEKVDGFYYVKEREKDA